MKSANLRAVRLPPPRTLSSYSVGGGSSSNSNGGGSAPSGGEPGAVTDGANITTYEGHSGTITAIKYSDDGNMIISACMYIPRFV